MFGTFLLSAEECKGESSPGYLVWQGGVCRQRLGDALRDERRAPEALTFDLHSRSTFPRPALVTDGETNPSYFPLVVTGIASVLAHVGHRTSSEAGHGPDVSHPDEYVKGVAEFILVVSPTCF